MGILTANINFLASLGITTSEQFTAAFGDMASFTEYCTAIGYSWELDENNDIILITPDGKKVNTYVPAEESEKTATPEIVVTPGDTEYTFEAIGDGDVKLYIDETEVSNPVAISRTNEAQEVTVTATAQEQGKQISDEAWEEVTIPALSGPSSISFDQNSYSASEIPEGQPVTVSLFSVTDDLGNEVSSDCTYSFSPNTTSLYVDDTQFCVTGSDPAGTYSVDVTATYEGLTATATVDFEIIASGPQSISFDQNSYSISNEEGDDSPVGSFTITNDLGDDITSDCTYSFSPNDTGLYVQDSSFYTDQMPAGTYSVDVTADYNGLTATATVNVDITSPVQTPNYMKLSVVGNTGANDEIEIYIPSDVGTSAATSISYSYDGTNWTDIAVLNQAQGVHIPVSTGDVIYLKGIAQRWGGTERNYSTNIISTVDYEASGNAMSLFYGDNFEGRTSFRSGSQYNLAYLFAGTRVAPNNHLIDASQLELPATALANYCYQNMFHQCTSLTTAPELPATTLADSCYFCMFNGCTSLTTAPELPAINLQALCYYCMFQGCTSLTTAPELPATTLADSCYFCMFEGCTSLNSITMLADDITAPNCLTNWVQNVAATGTFTKSRYIPESTIGRGDSGIPTDWTVVEPTGEQLMSIETPSTAGGYVGYWAGVSFNSVMLQFNDGQGNLLDIAGISDAPGIFTFDPNDKLGLTIDSYSTSGDEIVNGVRLGGSSEDRIEIAANAAGNCMLDITFGYDGSKITTYHPTCDWQAAGHSTYQDFVDSLPTEIRSYVSQDANNTNLAHLDTSYWTGCSTGITIDFTAQPG